MHRQAHIQDTHTHTLSHNTSKLIHKHSTHSQYGHSHTFTHALTYTRFLKTNTLTQSHNAHSHTHTGIKRIGVVFSWSRKRRE